MKNSCTACETFTTKYSDKDHPFIVFYVDLTAFDASKNAVFEDIVLSSTDE